MTKTRISIGVITLTILTVATLFLLPRPGATGVKTAVIGRGKMLETVLLEGVVSHQNEEMLVSLGSGRIAQICAAQGEQVKKGQLLILMDTAEEEATMSLLAGQLGRMEELDRSGAAYALLYQQRMDLHLRQAEVKKQIAMKQIRALSDGIMGNICCMEGGYVTEGTVLGSMHSEGICISAFARGETVKTFETGAEAFVLNERGERVGTAALERIGAVQQDSVTGAMVHPLWFSVDQDLPVGQRCTVEMVKRCWEDQLLAPVEAVSRDNTLWVVEDGAARSVEVEILRQDENYVSVTGELEGLKVILNPDGSRLFPGRSVREAKP